MIFEFYWTWHEDYSPILFEGPEKTREEFIADCKKAMAECFDEYMDQIENYRWASLPQWIEKAAIKLEDYGYKIFKPIAFGYFGLFLPKEKEDAFFDEDEDALPEFTEQIVRMKKHNTKVEENLWD